MFRHLLLGGALILAGCGSAAVSAAASASAAASDPLGAWQLASGTIDGERLQTLDGHPITAVVEGSGISGRSACNEYGGRVDVAPGGVAIAEVVGTDMACGQDEVMALESAYLEALGRVSAIEVIDGQLAMRGEGVDLRFDRQAENPTADLVDTTWEVETIFVGDVASAPAGEPATLELRADGTFRGTTGCRSFTGRWIEDGTQIRATQLLMDEAECPAELVEQDTHVVSVIGDGFVPSIERDLLTLLDPGGVGLVYRSRD